MTELDLELKDPQGLLEAIAGDVSYSSPGAWLVLVHHPATTQEVLSVRRLPDLGDPEEEATYDVWRERADHLCDLMGSLPIPPRPARGFSTVATTVVVRSGRNVWGWQEWAWSRAWRYSNHVTEALEHDILTVTEHGWSSWILHEGGREPRLALAAAGRVGVTSATPAR